MKSSTTYIDFRLEYGPKYVPHFLFIVRVGNILGKGRVDLVFDLAGRAHSRKEYVAVAEGRVFFNVQITGQHKGFRRGDQLAVLGKETAEEIFKMISEEKNEQTKLNDPYKVIPYPIYYEHTPSWWDAPWWKSPTITCKTATTISEGAVCACNTSDTADLLFRVTPNYASAIIVGNGEIWE